MPSKIHNKTTRKRQAKHPDEVTDSKVALGHSALQTAVASSTNKEPSMRGMNG
jgi:hypothetical protein